MALHLGIPLFSSNLIGHQRFHSFKSPSTFRGTPGCLVFCSSDTTNQRRVANYKPTVWVKDDIESLTSNMSTDDVKAKKMEKLKEEIRYMINGEQRIAGKLELVDNLRRLGVEYHFKDEIKDVMSSMFRSVDDIFLEMKDDIYVTALLFRLLRERGFMVSQDIFDRFRDEKGNFKTSLCNHTKGILSLYEASYLLIEGEDVLDEARHFTTKHLKEFLDTSSDHSLRELVAHALELPLHWRMPRLHTRWFIDMYKKKDSMSPLLLEFAKLDFNMVQSAHKSELKEVSRWWINLGLWETIPYSRDRLVENYMWSACWIFQPEYWRVREAETKGTCFVTAIDDTFDVYGTLEELEFFSDAVDRWDVTAAKQLPEYMRLLYLGLFNTTNDLCYGVMKDKGLDIIPYLKKAWADLCKAYLVEAKWYHKGYTPTLTEYLDNAWVSISGHLAIFHACFLSEYVSKEELDFFDGYLDVARCSCMIVRLTDDLGTCTDETNRGYVPKSVQCYMHEQGVTEAVAREYIKDLISECWKGLNAYRFASASKSSFHEYFSRILIDGPRISMWFYQNGDGYGKPDGETKDTIISLLMKPIDI